MFFFRRYACFAAILALAACARTGPSLGPSTLPALTQRTAADGDYTIRGYTYHIMPPRDSGRRGISGDAVVQYPDDLTNYGGPVMKTLSAHNIYVNCPGKNQSCWGAPEQFQKKLTGSKFAALLTQYTGSPPSAYAFGDATSVSYRVFPGTALYENDLFAIIHQVASTSKKTGFSNIYHVFLPKGTDTCFDFSNVCYSPDYKPTAGFCAYHGAIRYSDLGTVIYSVEPYQDVKGCLTKKSPGASELTNSTISTLAHETFEAITDPGNKLAWYNFVGGEIGDECEFFVSSVTLGGTVYNTQPMYSNKYHACATGP